MSDPAIGSATPGDLAAPLVERLRRDLGDGRSRIVVGLDGRSGSGKSTVAMAVAAEMATVGVAVTIVDGDDFYTGGSAATWDSRTDAEKAATVIDWRRQLAVLEQLRAGRAATWRPFDWDSEDWDVAPAPLAASTVTADATPVVVLEGAYSCRPELGAAVDLRVLLDVPAEVRRRQLLDREGELYRSDWEGRWSAAEEHYFGGVMPPERFDLVLSPPGWRPGAPASR